MEPDIAGSRQPAAGGWPAPGVGETQDGMAWVRCASYAGGMTALIETARDMARLLLEAPLPRRWTHVQAVAAKADRISAAVPVEDRSVLVASAWLHDVGYSPTLVDTGFHALDGGRWLRRNGSTGELRRWWRTTRAPGSKQRNEGSGRCWRLSFRGRKPR